MVSQASVRSGDREALLDVFPGVDLLEAIVHRLLQLFHLGIGIGSTVGVQRLLQGAEWFIGSLVRQLAQGPDDLGLDREVVGVQRLE
ncbi:MAG: hypothetical protein AUH74_03785 [Nitrospirae bacterium 13_1_40CM_4_62_6]|nr:MAG: hypothetical protein AUH74_03785 [Nitrospirae bacterium 13_1_40CM_4_62_6]